MDRRTAGCARGVRGVRGVILKLSSPRPKHP
jgi:hypothetical protein